MSYSGFEIFALALGNADSFFIRHYANGVKTNILIDGGNSSDGDVVLDFLRVRGETRLDHVVCSHHHADHSGGLIKIVQSQRVSIGTFWLHVEEMVSDAELVRSATFENQKAFARKVALSKANQRELLRELNARGIHIAHPFAGEGLNIGPLYILSPTRDFYARQIAAMKNEALQTVLSSRYAARELRQFLTEAQKQFEDDAEEKQQGLGGEPTSPENEVSTVLALLHPGPPEELFLFTADAGVDALTDVKSYFGDALRNLAWMQLPHHGSRRNLNEGLLDHFRPKEGWVSAKGSVKHPSRKLVYAVNARGGKIYGTFYPHRKVSEGNWMRTKRGVVPDMPNLVSLPALWD